MKKPLFFPLILTATMLLPQSVNAQWVSTSGPGGVGALVASGGNLFAGTGGGGVYLTMNNGTSWTRVSNGLTNLSIATLAANGGNVFAGTFGGGVFLSTNNGTSWTAVNNGLTNLDVWAFAANGGNVFAGTGGAGVFLTTNNGTNWTAVNNGLTNGGILSFAVNGGNLFAGTNGGGVFLSTNNGTSWTRVSNGLTNLYIRAVIANGGYIFAGTSGGGVFLTTNNGTNWTAVNNGLTNLQVYSLAASGGNIFAGTNGGGVFLTTNNGTNWIDFNAGLTGLPPVYALTASGSYLFAGVLASPGVYRRLLSDIANLPAAPILSSPANGATNVATSPTMIWNAVTGATAYRMQVSTSSTFSSMSVNDSTTVTSRVIGPLAGNTTYYWRVDAKNSYGWGAWSSVWSFTTRPCPLLIPYTPNPTSNRRPQLRWYQNSYISTYRIEIDTSLQFTLTIVSEAVIDTFYIPAADLPYDTIYWRVRNDADPLSWSAASSVMIVRPVPTLIAYTPNPTSDRRPQLRWYHHDSISIYRIQIDTSLQFTSTIVSEAVIDTFYTPVSDLPYGTIYWRVRNDADSLSWSTISSLGIMHIYPQGVVAHWSFDSSSGNTYYDVTGHGYDAVATGSGVELAQGVSGQALSCPGTSYEIYAVNSKNDFYLSKFTVESCYYSNVPPSGIINYAEIFSFQNVQSGVRNGFGVALDQQGHFFCSMSNSSGSAWENTVSTVTMSPSRWYHVVGTYDSSYVRIYVNGVLSASLAYQGTYMKPPIDCRIACTRRMDSVNAAFRINGYIDELKLYNYALSADTIAAHSVIYVAVGPAATTPLVNTVLKVQARSSLLTISLPSSMVNRPVDLIVYSPSGRVVMQKRIAHGTERLTLPAPNLALGAYVLAVKDGVQKKAVRFVVVR
ncbi:MAG: hypothetical protein JW768_12960 [Chitinispirillaceae bacterium]|nr:hypothetical protein [Chitinispirillaceae bacterium]